jgi:multidrug efflux pump subunit AcrA (membrane-fusion protein)
MNIRSIFPTHGQPSSGRRSEARNRPGFSPLLVLGILAVLAVLIGLVWYVTSGISGDTADAPLVSEIALGPYEHVVLEQGEVESSNNVEIRCDVRARNTSGPSTSIIDVVPEGTRVKEGDWLITFDSSALEQEQRQQKILCNTAEAEMIEAKALYDTAVIAKKEYLEGTY